MIDRLLYVHKADNRKNLMILFRVLSLKGVRSTEGSHNHFILSYVLFTALDCILPLNSTDDSLKAQTFLETLRRASQRQTELHKGTC